MSDWPWLVLLTVYGACVGSFLNVVIYRLPAGLSVIRPASRCPHCGHGLAAYDNIPVLGWLWLRGKCRYCKTPISVQYPLIEALCAVLFVGMYWVDYHSGWQAGFMAGGPSGTWPALVVQLALLAVLVAATGIDARYYIIPLEATHLVTALALVVLPLATVWLPVIQLIYSNSNHTVVVPPNGVGAAFGGLGGLMVAWVLLWKKVLPRSFDEEMIEPSDPAAATQEANLSQIDDADPTDRQGLLAGLLMILPLIGAMIGVGWWSWFGQPMESASTQRLPGQRWILDTNEEQSLLIHTMVGAMLGYVVVGLLYGSVRQPDEAQDIVGEYPNPRGEVLKESLFLVLPLVGAMGGYWLTRYLNGEAGFSLGHGPVWSVLGSVLMGYLVGGGVIWGVRVLGTLAFGREAMGLGDVHLLAAIGAVVGPRHAVLVFFLAPFFGLASALGMMVMSRVKQVTGRVIPYGPYLAAAAVAVMALRGPIERVFVIFFS